MPGHSDPQRLISDGCKATLKPNTTLVPGKEEGPSTGGGGGREGIRGNVFSNTPLAALRLLHYGLSYTFPGN